MNIMNLYVYENRSMSNDLSKPIMFENLNVDNVKIHIPKEIDGTDMGTWAWWFVYQNTKHEKYSIPMTLEGVTSDEGEEEYISTVGLNHGFTGKHGSVMYAIEAVQADGSGAVTHEWHTRTYKLEIVTTLHGNQTEYSETESDIISALISRANELITSGAEIAEIAETIESAAETAREVIDSIPADYSELSNRVGANTIALAEKADRATTYTKTEVDQMIEDVEVETDTTLEVAGAAADAAETGRQIGLLKADLDAQETALTDAVPSGNNIVKIPDAVIDASYYGMETVKIENNKITLKGSTPSSRPFRMKLTNGIDLRTSEQDDWANEDVSDIFESGKTYVLKYKVYKGTFPLTIGTPARVSKTPSVSFLSVTVPRNTVSASATPHYIMLYVPQNTPNIDVTFEPFFMEAYTSNDAYKYDISDGVKYSDKLTPKAEFNYFTVSVNPTLTDPTDTSTDNADDDTNAQTVNCVLTLPETYQSQGEKTPLIMYCHGRTDAVSVGDWVENDTKRLTLIRSFTAAGYGVFDVDAMSHPSGGAVDVGSPALMQAYIKAWGYIKKNYNVDDKLFIYSLSFGTFAALNMLCWYPTSIRTACMSAIRASHRAVFNRGTPFNTEIAANFGFADATGATYEAPKMLGYDPYADIVTIGNTDMLLKSFPPIKAFTSSGDTLELTEAHNLINALKAGGNAVNYREITGLNHSDMCYLADAGLRSEVVMWFDRFR